MKEKKSLLGVVLSFFCISFYLSTSAQSNLNGRSVALSSCTVNLEDEWSNFQNPAGASSLKDVIFGIGYKNNYFVNELNFQSLISAIPIKNSGVVSLGFSQYGYSLFKQQDFNLGWSRSYANKISGGIAFHYSHIEQGENYGAASIFKVTVGIQVKISSALQLGVVIDNPLRPQILSYNNERSSSGFFMGLKYNFSPKLVSYLQSEKISQRLTCIRIGIEYSPLPNFFIRGGIASNPRTESFGFGFVWRQLHIDIASTYHPILGFSPTISMGYHFTKSERDVEK